MLQDTDPLAIVALANCIDSKSAKAAKSLIVEGTTSEVSLVAQLSGTVKRGEATTAKPTARLLNKAVLAELIRRLGVTREAFKRHLLEIATESILAKSTTAKGMEEANPELLLALAEIERDIVDQLPRDHRAGSVKVAMRLDVSDITTTT